MSPRGPDAAIDDSYRIFYCQRCKRKVRICRGCDRRHRYCSRKCSRLARDEAKIVWGAAYQRTPIGRQKHAARQMAYQHRQREKKTRQHEIVTRQSSPTSVAAVILGPDLDATDVSSAPDAEEKDDDATPALPDAREVDTSAVFTVPADAPVAPATGTVDSGPGSMEKGLEAGVLVRCDFCGRLCGPMARTEPHRRGRGLPGAGRRTRRRGPRQPVARPG